MMLLTSDLNDYKFTGLYKMEVEGNKVLIKVYAEYKYIYNMEWLTIGCYDIESKEGRILLEGYKEYKYYKSLKTMINAIYKVNSNACMEGYDKVIEQIKAINKPTKQAKQIVKEESYIVGNRNFNTYDEAVKYCDSVDFDYSMIVC